MLDKEKKLIEKLENKQKQEIQQMIDYEMKLKETRDLNERKLDIAKERERKMKLEIERKQQLAEKDKIKKEQEKLKKEEEEL